jgi:malonate transporter and related proteins
MGLVLGRGRIGEATLAGVAGGFGNVGYMGPGPALATLGPEAAVPVALVFCLDALLIFVLVSAANDVQQNGKHPRRSGPF